MIKKIYVASSWRNQTQEGVVRELRVAGFEVYDFKNPVEGNSGFKWSDIDSDWQNWTPEQFRESLRHPIAVSGFNLDMDALCWCDACVLVLPCGRSAHLEAGYAIGAGKPTVILLSDGEPELMYRMADSICLDIEEVIGFLKVARPMVIRTKSDRFGKACETCLYSGAAEALEPCKTCKNHSNWQPSLLYQEYLKQLERVKTIADHMPECPADVLLPEVFSCDDITGCHGQDGITDGITACWRRVLGVESDD